MYKDSDFSITLPSTDDMAYTGDLRNMPEYKYDRKIYDGTLNYDPAPAPGQRGTRRLYFDVVHPEAYLYLINSGDFLESSPRHNYTRFFEILADVIPTPGESKFEFFTFTGMDNKRVCYNESNSYSRNPSGLIRLSADFDVREYGENLDVVDGLTVGIISNGKIKGARINLLQNVDRRLAASAPIFVS